MNKIEITYSEDIASCGDGCCHSEGYHIVNEKGEDRVFITDMGEGELKSLIAHLVGKDVKIIVRP
jgi:hypothetical protein